jgi:8-oxo-dGTP pyrophosphatase MutT (NUDIX family)/phosphohistidine phosphatase SixA
VSELKAAGGLVFRTGSDGGYEVLIVHRPRYGDWSLPKGKQDRGETDAETAVREVEEETGIRARVIDHLAEIEYALANGRPKRVHFFSMKPVVMRPFVPNTEVDDIRWIRPGQAEKVLTYHDDRWLVSTADYRRLDAMGTLLFVRHAVAGDRSKWKGDDHLRPITSKGRRQSEVLAELLADVGVDRIISSPYVRCVQTVEPLAERLGLEIETSEHLVEGADPKQGMKWLKSLSRNHVVLSSHGDMIPAYLERMSRKGMKLHSPHGYFDCKKGSMWAVHFEDGTPLDATYHPPPAV